MHFPAELPDLHATVVAAKGRVQRFENEAHGGLNVAARVRRFRAVQNNSDFLGRFVMWSGWFDSGFLVRFAQATDDIRIADSRRAQHQLLFGSTSADTVTKQLWQLTAVATLRAAGHKAELHLRRRLDRWQLTILPGHRPIRFHRALDAIALAVPPRVLAAFLRVSFDGLPTCRMHATTGDLHVSVLRPIA